MDALIAGSQSGLDGLSDQDVVRRAQVESVAQAAVASVVTGPWTSASASNWKQDILNSCLKGLAALNKPYKYAVCCHLAQRNGSGLYSAAAGFWNQATDGCAAIIWESQTVFASITIMWAAL